LKKHSFLGNIAEFLVTLEFQTGGYLAKNDIVRP